MTLHTPPFAPLEAVAVTPCAILIDKRNFSGADAMLLAQLSGQRDDFTGGQSTHTNTAFPNFPDDRDHQRHYDDKRRNPAQNDKSRKYLNLR